MRVACEHALCLGKGEKIATRFPPFSSQFFHPFPKKRACSQARTRVWSNVRNVKLAKLYTREHISLVICVPLPGKHISLMICVPLPGKHISVMICVPLPGKHISLMICVPLPGKHISLVTCVPLPGENVSLVICVPLPENTYP